MKRLHTSIAALLFATGAAGNGVHAETFTVETRDYAFHPAEITVHPGDTVHWVNTEKRQYHSVWFKAEGGPKSEYFWPGEGFKRTFHEPGDYPYVCEPHGESHAMKGVVHVVPE